MKLIKATSLILSLILLFITANLYAAAPSTIVGVYDKVPGEEFKFDGKKIEVVEYMSFYCHACYDFEKSIPVIKGNYPGKIDWIIVPVYWGEHGSSKPGEAYMIANEMGKGEAMKKALFKAHMVQKKNIGDIGVLEGLAKEIGLGSEFSRKLKNGYKAGEAQNALHMARKIGLNETPTVVIAGNLKTDPHPMNHNLDVFRTNIIAIIHSILNQK